MGPSGVSVPPVAWEVSDADPERWPVVTWWSGDEELERHDGGLADFLVALLTGRHPEGGRSHPQVSGWSSVAQSRVLIRG